ncbi:MAG: TerB family tellurite resistance protein [Rhodospirillales bacterium]|nr:TerB family tellurite resistance protein [Rhodospirillales bacterium]
MTFWGKVFGGMAGFAFGGPLGALAGAFAGHAMDRLREQAEALGLSSSQAARQTTFAVAAIILGAKVAKADGHVSRAEVAAFKQVFRIPPEQKANVGRIFNMAKRDARGFEPHARQVAALFRDEPAVLEELLSGLFHVARADGPLRPAQRTFLRQVADIFAIRAPAFERVEAGFTPQAGGDPYAVLGVSPGAGDDVVKAAYRRLIRENHPDTLVAKGMSPDFVQVANARMAAINAAYDEIEKRRGLR